MVWFRRKVNSKVVFLWNERREEELVLRREPLRRGSVRSSKTYTSGTDRRLE